jgi:NADPH:quinone reductase
MVRQVPQPRRCYRPPRPYDNQPPAVEAFEQVLLQLVEVIDLSTERLADGVNRLTDGYGADIIVDGLGGNILSEALQILAPGGSLTTLGYAAGRETTIDVTNLGASIKSFLLFSETVSARLDAWSAISKLFASGQIKPIVAKTFALEDAAQAIRYLVEDRPLGRVVLTF